MNKETTTKSKRNLFRELVQGFKDLADERKGKITLRTTKVSEH